MGWNNPPVPWRELRRRMAWRAEGEPPPDRTACRHDAAGRRLPPRRLARPHGTAVVPWAELHCHSSYSFLDGAATPGELVAEAARLGLETLAITDHDGMYGVPQFAQAAARLRDQGVRLGTVFGAELSLDLPSGPDRRARPGRPLTCWSWPATPKATPGCAAVISAAQLAGAEKGRPVYDTGALAGAHGGHWVVLTGCRKGPVPAALAAGRAGRGLAGAGPADRDVRPRERDGRAELPPRPRRRRAQRPAGPAGRPGRRGRGGHRQRALRGARAGPAGPGAGRHPGPAQPGRHGRLAGRGGHRLPAVGAGDGRAAAALPGRAGADRGAGPRVRVRLPRHRAQPARLPRPVRPHRGVLAARAGGAQGPGPVRAARRRARARRVPRRSTGSST